MTQEDKELLLKDICARLTYGVKYNFNGDDGCDYVLDSISRISIDDAFPIEDCKPYLRPMSSMTEEEKEEYLNLMPFTNGWEVVMDWLNAHQFDFRNLIGKGLAIEAPEEMYNLA